jgi:hypothetical protein
MTLPSENQQTVEAALSFIEYRMVDETDHEWMSVLRAALRDLAAQAEAAELLNTDLSLAVDHYQGGTINAADAMDRVGEALERRAARLDGAR